MSWRLASLTVCLGAGLMVLGSAWAESEPERGRLADGRAFRTDDQGNQLVDYIAELEVNIQQLERQVQSLEGDVKDKQAQIERLSQARPAAPALEEKNLLLTAEQKPQAAAPGDCSGVTASITQELEAAKADLDVERRVGAQKVEALSTELSTVRASVESQASQIETLKLQLTQAQGEAESLRSTSQQLQAELEQSRVKQAAALEPLVPPQPLAAKRIEPLPIPALAPEARASLDTNRSSLSLARARAVESLRGKMLTDINQLRGLIAQRDEQYRRYSQRQRRVEFKPAPARSERNRGLDQIVDSIKQASSVYELSTVSREINQIETRVREDLALMKRMEKVG